MFQELTNSLQKRYDLMMMMMQWGLRLTRLNGTGKRKNILSEFFKGLAYFLALNFSEIF